MAESTIKTVLPQRMILSKIFHFIIWILITAFWASITPFLFLASIAWCSFLFGMDAHGWWQFFVTMGVAGSSADWVQFAPVARILFSIPAAIVVGYRIIKTPQFSKLCKCIVEYIERLAGRLLGMIKKEWRYDQEIIGNAPAVVISVLVFSFFLIVGFNSETDTLKTETVRKVRSNPSASAAAICGKNEMQSGPAEVEKIRDGKYIVTFKAKDKKERPYK
ncbi:MAG: hypothetical protein PVH87_26215 [Desulfobacteraceae bacterium]|jgi:hypothetical protein